MKTEIIHEIWSPGWRSAPRRVSLAGLVARQELDAGEPLGARCVRGEASPVDRFANVGFGLQSGNRRAERARAVARPASLAPTVSGLRAGRVPPRWRIRIRSARP